MFSSPLPLLIFANASDDAQARAIASAFAAFGLFWILFCIAMLILSLIINWRITEKAGFPGAGSLLMLIPLANLFVLCFFAFSEWPIERDLREARSRGGPVSPIAS